MPGAYDAYLAATTTAAAALIGLLFVAVSVAVIMAVIGTVAIVRLHRRLSTGRT